MRRYFNTEGQCEPEVHYMVNIDERLEKIKRRYIERGSYFIINRGRQYGKTTTLRLLVDYLKEEYFVISLDFQELTTANFENECRFVEGFIRCFIGALKEGKKKDSEVEWQEKCIALLADVSDMGEMFSRLSRICGMSEKPIVLMIDEVDSASNNQVFIDFLGLLRRYYLNRSEKPIFQSVILAGVYDIKNLKLKIRPDAEHQYNSPWNIAAKFTVEMSLSAEQIASMLQEYEEDNHTGMDIEAVSLCIYEYTSGYPYLVSAVCKYLDEETGTWTGQGVAEAVKYLLNESTPLFDSLTRQISEYPELKRMLKAIVFQGKRISYNLNTHEINLAAMFGYIKNSQGSVQVANRIFETLLCNLFLSEEELTNAVYDRAQGNIAQFIQNGRLDMDFVLEKFVQYFTEIYGGNAEKFIEENGRRLFLLFLKPIINGTGNYYLEAQTRDARRTDVIVDYLGEQYVIELKIWHGDEYNERGEEQLAGYFDYYHKDRGYLISFNLNKKKEIGVKTIVLGDRVIVEAVV